MKNLYGKLETALKKTLSPDCPSDANVYVSDKENGVFLRGHGDKEYVVLHRKREIAHIKGVCAIIRSGQFGTTDVCICPEDDDGADFRIKEDRIVRIDMYGNPCKATEWVERFVPAFSEAMGGTGRFR